MPKMQDTMNINVYYRESIRPHVGPEFDTLADGMDDLISELISPRKRTRWPIRNTEPREPASPAKRAIIYQRDGETCWYCWTGGGGPLQLDHIIPRTAFPTHQLHIADRSDNLVTACASCNEATSNAQVLYLPAGTAKTPGTTTKSTLNFEDKITQTCRSHQKWTTSHTADATAIQHGYQKLKDGFYDSRLRGTLLRNQKPTSNRRILSRQRHQREHYTNQGATMSDITGPAAIRAINALLEDHYPVDDGIWGQHCATCITDGGAVGADVMDWPCDIYTTIQDAIGDQK